MDETTRALAVVTRSFDELGSDYAIVGSVASGLFGELSTIHAVDVVACISVDLVEGFLRSLDESYYADSTGIRDEVRRRGMFNLIHLETMVKVGVLVDDGSEHAREQMRRRRPVDLPGDGGVIRVYAAAAEDVVLAKLRWFRRGGEVSTVQWRDVLGVLATQKGRLDTDYLRSWAAKLGVTDLLHRAFADAVYSPNSLA